jgi:hypothetical protein
MDKESQSTMNNINTRKWSTPMIIGTGLFVALSGVMMFFGVHNPIQLAHEWIGLLFAVGILLHVLNHWKAFRNYFSQSMALALVGSVAVITSLFIGFSSTQAGGNTMMDMVRSFETSPVVEIAPLLDESAESVVGRFEAAGYSVEGPESTLKEIAVANGSEPRALVKVLFTAERS